MMTEQEKWEFENKDETIKRLETALRGGITIYGELTKGKWDINYSSILTKLIQEAGRWCEHYASDLFITWEILEKRLNNGDLFGKDNRLVFAFREMGVDEISYYERHKADKDYYRAVWFLDVTTADELITMRLHK
jgi:hypothetical protein